MRIALIITTLMMLAVPLSYAGQGNKYPPENAALIYYKMMANYPPDNNEIMRKISDYSTDEIELDEEIVKHLDQYQYVIQDLAVAGQIKECNWGIDFSKGVYAMVPGLSNFKKYGYLLTADARRLIAKSDYYEALNRCLTAEKLASHVSGHILINSLVGTSINSITDKCIGHVLSQEPAEEEKLIYLRDKIGQFDNRIQSMKAGLIAEKQLFAVMYDKFSPHKLTYDMLTQLTYPVGQKVLDPKTKDPVKKKLIESLKSNDGKFFDQALKYNNSIISDAADAFDKPYVQAREIVSKQIPEKLENDSKKKPEALLANLLMPTYLKVYGSSVRSQNSLNALKAALEVYLVKAKTGKLPNELPANTPRDLYTDKQMIYEITDDGFILRCQGPDTKRDKEKDTYIFKVKK